MSTTVDEIRKMLEQLIDNRTAQAFIVQGKVLAVNQEDSTCDVQPLIGGAAYQDVRLQTIIGAEPLGIVLYPKLESQVLILVINETEYFLLSCQEISSLYLSVADKFQLEIDEQGNCLIDEGKNGGLIKIDELRTQIDKNTAFINGIKSVLNGVVIPEAGNGSPSVLQIALKAASGALPLADLSNIENTKIKH